MTALSLLLVMVGIGAVSSEQQQPLHKEWEKAHQAGDEHYQRGEYPEAAEQLAKALALCRKLYPREEHADLVASLNLLGAVHQALGQYDKAETHYRQALTMRQKLTGEKDHVDLVRSLNNLGAVLHLQRKYDQAEVHYVQALQMTMRLYPKNDDRNGQVLLAATLNNAGQLFEDRQRFDKAQLHYEMALQTRKKLYPEKEYRDGHPDLAISLNNLGHLHRVQGQDDRAETFYRQALAMREKLYPKARYPDGHPHLANSLHSLGFLLRAQGRHDKAEPHCRQALEMYQGLLRRQMDILAEAEVLTLFDAVPSCRDSYLSVTRHLPPDKTSYDLLWQGRGAVLQLLRRRHLDLLVAADPKMQEKRRQLADARLHLSRHLLSPLNDPQKHRQRTRELTEAKEGLEKELIDKLRLDPKRLQAPSTTPAELSKALPADTVFVDLIRYTDFEQDPRRPGSRGEKWTRRYVAFVLGPNAAAIRVELNEAETIEQAWAKWKQAITRKEPDGKAAAALAALLWTPLRQHLPADSRVIYLAADDLLSQLPWGAMPDSKSDKVLLEDYSFVLVPHGSFLLERLTSRPGAEKERKGLLAVGGVDYFQAPDKVKSPAEGLFLRSPPEGKKLVWGKLPGTEKEQTLVAELAARVLSEKPLTRSGTQASTEQLMQDLQRVRYAHLATHGFFADEQFRSVLQVDGDDFKAGPGEFRGAARSPLVLSGLVFAGANLTGDVAMPDRGLLTAEAIVSLNLCGLDLAVLSGCETGRAELRVGGGEGVYGLQRAFHVAGCANVIASLWKVEDEATAVLMGLFYRNLWIEKMSPGEALRQAQLFLYRHPQAVKELGRKRGPDFTARELPRVSVPVDQKGQRAATAQWAAFVLSGADR